MSKICSRCGDFLSRQFMTPCHKNPGRCLVCSNCWCEFCENCFLHCACSSIDNSESSYFSNDE